MLFLVHHLIDLLAQRLNSKHISPLLAHQEAWWMLELLTKKTRTTLISEKEISLSHEQQQQLDTWIALRIEEQMPLQYILGSVPFCGLDIAVMPPILIPRPETEELATWLIDSIKHEQIDSLNILDLCTGSGCIALALAHHLPQATVVGVDINPQALELARKNQELNSIVNATFILSNLYSKLNFNEFDIIVTNPPYLSYAEYEAIDDSVKKWEDSKALVAPDDGMYFYHHIIRDARKYLKLRSGSQLQSKIPAFVCEFGPAQKDSLADVFVQNGFSDVRFFMDLQGELRWAAASI